MPPARGLGIFLEPELEHSGQGVEIPGLRICLLTKVGLGILYRHSEVLAINKVVKTSTDPFYLLVIHIVYPGKLPVLVTDKGLNLNIKHRDTSP